MGSHMGLFLQNLMPVSTISTITSKQCFCLVNRLCQCYLLGLCLLQLHVLWLHCCQIFFCIFSFCHFRIFHIPSSWSIHQNSTSFRMLDMETTRRTKASQQHLLQASVPQGISLSLAFSLSLSFPISDTNWYYLLLRFFWHYSGSLQGCLVIPIQHTITETESTDAETEEQKSV